MGRWDDDEIDDLDDRKMNKTGRERWDEILTCKCIRIHVSLVYGSVLWKLRGSGLLYHAEVGAQDSYLPPKRGCFPASCVAGI